MVGAKHRPAAENADGHDPDYSFDILEARYAIEASTHGMQQCAPHLAKKKRFSFALSNAK